MFLSLTEFIGRFHPLLVHLPIGILLIALLLQWLSHRQQYALSYGAMRVIWLCGASAALISCITGYLLSLSGEYDAGTVSLHMWMAIAATAVSAVVCIKVFTHRFDIVYKGALVCLLLLIFATGHFGGSLTHGSDYLTAALSNSTATADAPPKVIPDIQQAYAYADVVEPLLQSKCYGCHGATKQKGGLRMDGQQWLLKGGKNGEILVAGKAEESELIKRLLLAREEEHHMPPKEKPQFNERQVALLHWWIDHGADFAKRVKDLPQPEKIKPVLLALQGNAEKKAAATVPETPVEPADENAMQMLRNRGVIVIPVAQNSHYIMANFVTVTNINDDDMKLLLPLKKQLVWLKAGTTPIGDSALNIISQCTNISLLQLNETGITDKGLPLLKSLINLQSLNLVGTKVSAQGVLPLQSLKNLRAVYLYKTGVNKDGWKQLSRVFPKVQLDTGGYIVPFLTTDTTLVTAPLQK